MGEKKRRVAAGVRQGFAPRLLERGRPLPAAMAAIAAMAFRDRCPDCGMTGRREIACSESTLPEAGHAAFAEYAPEHSHAKCDACGSESMIEAPVFGGE